MAQTLMSSQPSSIQREWRDWLLFIALVGPNLAMFVIFSYRPLIYNAYLSNRSAFYAQEQRWPTHPFWRRRHGLESERQRRDI